MKHESKSGDMDDQVLEEAEIDRIAAMTEDKGFSKLSEWEREQLKLDEKQINALTSRNRRERVEAYLGWQAANAEAQEAQPHVKDLLGNIDRAFAAEREEAKRQGWQQPTDRATRTMGRFHFTITNRNPLLQGDERRFTIAIAAHEHDLRGQYAIATDEPKGVVEVRRDGLKAHLPNGAEVEIADEAELAARLGQDITEGQDLRRS